MKDYSKKFDETYNEVFEQYEKQKKSKKFRRNLIIMISSMVIAFVAFVGGAMLRLSEAKSLMDTINMCIQTPLMWILGVAAGVIVMKMWGQFKNQNTDICQIKAMEFATTIYLDDFITALENEFILESGFKDTVKIEMEGLCWYDEENNTFSPGFFLENECYLDERIISKSTGKNYYLISWEDKKTGFFIEFLEVEGKMKCTEFFLPVPEK